MVRVGLWQWCCCCLAAEVLLLLLRTRLEDLQEDTGATAERVVWVGREGGRGEGRRRRWCECMYVLKLLT